MSNERNCKERTEYEILLDKEKMETTKETSYEDGLVIAENYAKYEREIAELEKQNYEQLLNLEKLSTTNDNQTQEISDLKKQIAELHLKLFITNPLITNKGAK